MSKKTLKILLIPVTIIVLAIFAIFSYLIILPAIISSQTVWDTVQKYLKTVCDAELVVYKPSLKTSLSPHLAFKSDSIYLAKNEKVLLSVQNLDFECDFSEILNKKLILEKVGADELYMDVNSLSTLKIKQTETAEQPSDFTVDWFESVFYIKKCAVFYKTPQNVLIKFLSGNISLAKTGEKRFLRFGTLVDVDYQNERLRFLLKDKDNIYIKDHKLFIDDFNLKINKSNIKINAVADKYNHFDLSLYSDKFDIANVDKFLRTNMLIPNGDEVMNCFQNLSGDFNFKVNITEKSLNSIVNVNKITGKLIPLANIPLTINKGSITVNSQDIQLKDFKGFYGSSKINEVAMYGTIKNYPKTADTELIITGSAYDELASYISKLAGSKINIVKNAPFALKVLFDISGKVDVKGGVKIPQGSDLLFENMSISPNKFDRAMGIDVSVIGNDVFINHINYYIADHIAENVRPNKPLVTVKAITNAATGYLKELEFKIPEPLPSEFFNVLVGQKVLKRGTFFGNLKFINSKTPKIFGKLDLNSVRIVGQHFFLKNASVKAAENFVTITSDGTFRRTKYNFSGQIQNKILFPIIVENINLNIAEIDVERIMQTFAPRTENAPRKPRPQNPNRPQAVKSDVPLKYFEVEEKQTKQETTTSDENTPIEFQPNLIIVKNCKFNAEKGSYKQIKFGNLHADLTLSKDGILQIQSNKFDFADGISTLKVYCDLLKQKYSVRLGAKDVDTDAIATSVLNLSREISGKASALLEFNTDNSAKLNGKIQFAVNNGSISKLGLVQYALNAASLFRNPLAMISPSTLFDLINIPDGTFNKINGTLIIKDNIVERMMIKSASPQLSAFIIGRLNLESMDASLRVYTKFSSKNKGIEGFLRAISLNALAKKVNSSQNEHSYYTAELSQLPKLEIGEETSQVFLTKIDGDIQTSNYISSLKKIK